MGGSGEEPDRGRQRRKGVRQYAASRTGCPAGLSRLRQVQVHRMGGSRGSVGEWGFVGVEAAAVEDFGDLSAVVELGSGQAVEEVGLCGEDVGIVA